MWTFVARGATRLISAAGLLVLVIGIPAGQLRYIGWPLPDQAPTLAELHTTLTSRDWFTDAAYLDALSVLLWLLWLLFTISVAVEVTASIRGVRAPRYRLLAPTQGLAAALVAGLTATIVATAPAPALTHTPHTATAHPAGTTAAAVLVAPAAPASTLNRIDAVTLKPVGTVTVLINGQLHEHTVVKGESLWRIADTYLGDPERWPEIWELNKGKYWPHVSGRTTFHDPDLIFPGWVLTLPPDATAAPGTGPVDPPPQQTFPPSPTTSPTTATPMPSATPSTAGPTPSMTAPAGAVPTPPSTAGSSATPTRPATTSPAAPTSTRTAAPTPTTVEPSQPADDPASSAMPGWIRIAGGFIGVGFAVGLLYAAAMVWKRRRHRYRPTPITSPVLDDADLAPPLAALTHIRQHLRRQAPHLLEHQPDRGPTVREYTTAEVKPPLPPVGPTGADLAGVATLPVSAGLGLRGPAALDAARALLVATLTSGRVDDPDAQGRAIVPGATLASLLGVSAVDLAPMHRLTVAPSFADALTLVEEEIIRRSRIIADHEVADVAALRDSEALAEPLPQLLLIADVPDEAWHARLATAIRLGKAVEIGTALIGDWPHGSTLTVAEDGATSGGDGQRVAVLDTTATSQMLAMLGEAHGDAAPHTTDRDASVDVVPAPRPSLESTVESNETAESSSAPTDVPDGAQSPNLRIVDVRVLVVLLLYAVLRELQHLLAVIAGTCHTCGQTIELPEPAGVRPAQGLLGPGAAGCRRLGRGRRG